MQKIADRYELTERLGEGGMGVVWKARDIKLGRSVAVKLLTQKAVGSDAARTRLIREARAAAQLEHDGIIRVYDVGGLPDGGAFLVMALVRGKTLRLELANGPLPLQRALDIIRQTARALQFAHDAGVVHRDIKPDNIMLREDDRVIVVDFGVAKPVATGASAADGETVPGVTNPGLTSTGQIVGTPAYLSPEQARGPEVGPAADQFALGITAYEAITGKRPWDGETAVEVIAALLKDDPKPMELDVPGVEKIIFRALAKKPEDRWPDMEAFAKAIEEAAPSALQSLDQTVENTPLQPDPILSTDNALTTTPRATTTSAVGGTPKYRKQRGLALFLALIIGVGFVLVRRRGAQTIEPVACLPLEVKGTNATWLGSAAATLACERVAMRYGGVESRTLFPAELLGAPREVSPSFPKGLFDNPDREKARKHARGPRIEGTVEKQADGFAVHLVLHHTHEVEADGRGVELYEAVREALKPILPELPVASENENKHLREWLDVDSADDAMKLLDLHTAIMIEDPTSLKAECATTANVGSPRVHYLAKSQCQRKLRTEPLTEQAPALDESTPGALITTALALGAGGGPEQARGRAAKLEKVAGTNVSAESKARLAAAAAEIYNLVGDERARELARNAVQQSPKAIDWRANPWHRMAFGSTGDPSLSVAMQTWHPWEPVAHAFTLALGSRSDAGVQADSQERIFLLSRRGPYASGYGTYLIERGDTESAHAVAKVAEDDALRIELMLAEARYGEVLRTVPEMIKKLPATDATAAMAFRLAYGGMRAAAVLERSPDFVSDVVDRWVTSTPHHVIDGVAPVVALIHACVFAPKKVGERCIARLEELRKEGKLPTVFSTIDSVLSGASRYVAGDLDGAVQQWRTLLRSPGWVQGPLREPLAVAFDRAKENDLAEEVDGPVLALVDLPRTADLAWARAAERAATRGDPKRARKLATITIDKWRFADEKVPAVDRMKTLLQKTPE